MITIDDLDRRLAAIEKILEDLSSRVDSLVQLANRPKRTRLRETIPDVASLQAEYERLYGEFASKNSAFVRNFLDGKSKLFLAAFCRANNLPVDVERTPKKALSDRIMNWMHQGRALTSTVKPASAIVNETDEQLGKS